MSSRSLPRTEPCPGGGRKFEADRSLPILAVAPSRVRPSSQARRRALVLAAVHALMFIHVLHWILRGRTVSPVEPSEAMYTLNQGRLNAGFLFFTAAILATLLLGRFVCGWGCHFVAYQDLCAWLLGKAGIKPKAFRSRWLVLAPLILAGYMFAWPSVYRWWLGLPGPAMSNHLLVTDFWATFPGPVVGVLTVLLAGGGIVYFLGSKGFCTYACPYGGLFGLVEPIAVGRIRVTDDCAHCGHCTAVCTSNVRVHEEVARFGMVVDPGCMKCMDCVSVCPNDALYFGFGRPAVSAPARRPGRERRFDFRWIEEGLMGVVGVVTLLSLRGLYNKVPLLLSMGLAAISGFLAVKLVQLFGTANVRLQNLQLRRGGVRTNAGRVVIGVGVLWFSFVVHSGLVQWFTWNGQRSADRLNLPDSIWVSDAPWAGADDPSTAALLRSASAALERADRWGILDSPSVVGRLSWLYMAEGRLDDAERMIRRALQRFANRAEACRALACVYRRAGRFTESESSYRDALRFDPGYDLARRELADFLAGQGRPGDVITLFEERVTQVPDDAEARYQLGMSLLSVRRLGDAVAVLREAVRLNPRSPLIQYNLGVAVFMTGDPVRALEHVKEASRLDPADAQTWAFLAVVREALGDVSGAEEARTRAVSIQADSRKVDESSSMGPEPQP